MYDDYFLRILMREREREILKELGSGVYHVYRRPGDPGLLKKRTCRLLSTLLEFKTFAGPGQNRQKVTDLKRNA